jgi:hypothetical protein
VLYNMEEVGTRDCRMSSSHTTIVIMMLYGRRCQTPLFWNETGEQKQVRMVRENLCVTQSRQKSYTDHRRRELSFEVGDFVYLKVSPMRGLCHFKVRGKLAPKFTGPFKILQKRGEVAYQ